MTLKSQILHPQFFKPVEQEHKNFVPIFIEDFLEHYADEELDMVNGCKFKATELKRSSNRTKINPILQIAKPEEAYIITGLFEEAYNGSYPYKEFLDETELQKRLKKGNLNFVLLKSDYGEVYGCIKFLIEPDNHRGYNGGMALWKRFLGKIDVTRAYIGMNLYFMRKYKDKIKVVYGEARTAHAKVQYFCELCGLLPTAVLVNKDFFLGKVESDLYVYAIQRSTLNERMNEYPTIIPEAVASFAYCSDRYGLGPINVRAPKICCEEEVVYELLDQIDVSIEKDKYGYHDVVFKLDSGSFCKFLYTPMVQNFENVEYEVQSVEELIAFITRMQSLARKLNVRYLEVYVSAFKPEHQKVFLEAGMRPRGYIPSWKYDEATQTSEDHIIFNSYKEEISEDIQLIQSARDLYHALDIH